MAGAKPGHEVSAETRAKISATLTGRKLSPERRALLAGRTLSDDHRAKISAGLRRYDGCSIDGCERPHSSRGWCSTHYMRWRTHGDPLSVPPPLSGEAHPRWKGNKAGYSAVHKRAQEVLPPVCAACGATDGRLEVALRRDTPKGRLHLDEKNGWHSTETIDYVRLCVECHRRYDSPLAATRRPIEQKLTR